MNFTQTELREFALYSCEKLSLAQSGVQLFSEPYKHLVIDNFFSPQLADSCLNNFPSLLDESWEYANDADIEIKYRTCWKSEFDIPDGIINAIRIMNSSLFLKAMSEIMDIPKIIPDPYFTGGGLNVTTRGGLLDVHVDGNYHDATGLNRRLNALVYLNPSWEAGWGGEFGLYDEVGNVCLKKIEPLHNRLVIFDSHDKSYHGLPEPINFPEGQQRRSIILYYYTKDPRPPHQVSINEPHSALWKKRDFLDKRGNRKRDFT